MSLAFHFTTNSNLKIHDGHRSLYSAKNIIKLTRIIDKCFA